MVVWVCIKTKLPQTNLEGENLVQNEYKTEDVTFGNSAGKLTEKGVVFRMCYIKEMEGREFDGNPPKNFWVAEGYEKDEFSSSGESKYNLTFGSKKLHRVLSMILADLNPENDGRGVWVKVCGIGEGYDRNYHVAVMDGKV